MHACRGHNSKKVSGSLDDFDGKYSRDRHDPDFHSVLIDRVMPEWNKTGAFSYSYLQSIPKDEFTASCERSGLDCYIGSDIEGSALGERLKQSLGPIHEHSVAQHSDRPIVFGYALNDETTTSVATTVLYIYDHGEARVIASPVMGTYIHDHIKLNFFILVCCASNAWLFGTIFLLSFHKRRFAKRAGSRKAPAV
ncbi:hypothetical protein [Pseudomonas amygdali]|uniref:Transmembrane protein n=2 Tax=Pseudomonas amygdali pv. lachrymans TaxID=53707 RepID=A0ABR5KUT7_PSEAV|nr:hypothetical protein [Pseudomonas amygdali]AXH59786.1 hypothetical protein PLA107_031680 [Pseudomonas amygdali pv. lachrymans str. M301315]KPC17205.1 putative transmembrane protein [Pseudomonas amygdali pv. lachrymans]KPC18164.1 putative transmembrane protein [Pseudomonas amygdali pv. lachrymans]RMT05658.1 putative transmembrane protein [Pseudomonas amygdali pv. lachrymans]